MPAAVFAQNPDYVDYTPTADVDAGDVIVVGDLVMVAPRPIRANTLGALAAQGIFDVAKTVATGSAITMGAEVYWDATNHVATTNSNTGANKLMGKCSMAAADTDATVRVRLHQ